MVHSFRISSSKYAFETWRVCELFQYNILLLSLLYIDGNILNLLYLDVGIFQKCIMYSA